MFDIPVLSFGEFSITLYALLAAVLCLAAAVFLTFFLRRRGWSAGQTLLCCGVAGFLGLLLGRALYCAVRIDFFLDPETGESIHLPSVLDLSLGGICITGVIAGLFLGGWLISKCLKKDPVGLFDIAAVPGLVLFALLSFIEPLSGQGYGPVLTLPVFCWPPLGIQNGFGEWILSVSFLEGLLLLLAAGIVSGLRLHRDGNRILSALVLVSCFMIIPESLRQDDVLQIFVFARVTQLGYCAILIISANLIWRNSARSGMSGRAIALEALLLLIHIAILVAGEFALDKASWPDGLVYLVMGLILIGTAWLLIHRIRFTEKKDQDPEKPSVPRQA